MESAAASVLHGKLMMNTFHIFDDRVYITRNGAGKPVMSAISPTNAATDNSKKDAEMRKMIGLAASSNPVTARLADYMGPILSILQLQNQLARTIYTISLPGKTRLLASGPRGFS